MTVEVDCLVLSKLMEMNLHMPEYTAIALSKSDFNQYRNDEV